jgi:hypothetical protein
LPFQHLRQAADALLEQGLLADCGEESAGALYSSLSPRILEQSPSPSHSLRVRGDKVI